MPNTQKVSSSSLHGDKTFILLGSAQHVPQPQQKNGMVPLPILKQNKAIESVQKLASMKPSYNHACIDYSDTAYSEQTFRNERLENSPQKRQRS